AFPEYEADEKRVSLALWNWRTGQLKYLFRERTGRITRLQFSPDGRTLAAAFSDSWTLACWDLASGEEHQWGPAHSDRVISLAFSQDSQVLVSGSDDQSFKLWDLSRRQLLATRECTDCIYHLAFSPDGKILGVGTKPKVRRPEREALTLWNW